MGPSQEAAARCAVLLFAVRGSASAERERSLTARASPGNYIIREEHVVSLPSTPFGVLSEVPVTVQRYVGGAELPARSGCSSHPLGDREGVILVTSDCDTSQTGVLPEISLGGDSIDVALGVAPEHAASMDFLAPSTYEMQSSYTACTEVFCGENPWAPIPTYQPSEESRVEPTDVLSVSSMSPTKSPTHVESGATARPSKSPIDVGSAAPSDGPVSAAGAVAVGSGGDKNGGQEGETGETGAATSELENGGNDGADDGEEGAAGGTVENAGNVGADDGEEGAAGGTVENGRNDGADDGEEGAAGGAVENAGNDGAGDGEEGAAGGTVENGGDDGANDGEEGAAGGTGTEDDIDDFATDNGAVSPRSILFGLPALARGVHSKIMQSEGETHQKARSLDTCTYNVEIFLNGCTGGAVNVIAPKVRVANADSKFTEVITAIDDKMSKFNESVVFAFPAEQMTDLDGTSGDAVQVAKYDGFCNCCVCVGRPFVDASGGSLQAMPLFATDHASCSWPGEGAAIDGGSDKSSNRPAPTQNELLLGEEWTRSALGEHASIASFSAFAIALMTNGAPSDLVEDALKAGLDETRHAEASFAIASALTGREVGPGPLPGSTHAFHRNLTELAVSTAREGCVDETLSAIAAAAEVEAIDAALETNGGAGPSKYRNVTNSTLIWMRDELRKIALDESNHAALAWRTLKWACSVDAVACRETVEAVLEEKKLLGAFHRRFRTSLNGEDGYPIKLMADSWRKIYAVQKSFELDSGTSSNEMQEHDVCVISDLGTTSLLHSLVDNVLHSVMCK